MSNNIFRQILSGFFRLFFRLFSSLVSLSWALLIVFSILLTSFSFWAMGYFRAPGPLAYGAVLVIPEGTPLKGVSNMLADNNVIKYPEIFTLIIRVAQFEKQAMAGEYAFAPAMSPFQVFEKISSGDVVVRNITIPEGVMTSQVAKILESNQMMTGEIPADLKEGELLPETYGYSRGYSRAKIIARMQDSMNKYLENAWESRAEGLPFANKYEALVLASIVEKETAVAAERKRIAAVFVNRLRKNMRLQTDPTVIYAITEGKFVLDRPLTYQDLQLNSPYNTYVISGLPPTPIANPGKASIDAVMNPLETSELYFVADGTGGHSFASELKEHNANVAKWRKINADSKKGQEKVTPAQNKKKKP